MSFYKVVTFGKYRRPVATVSVKAGSKPEALTKAKEKGAFPKGVRGYSVTKIATEEKEVTLDFCVKEIVKNGYIRIGASILTHCYDGTVSVSDWNGHTVWFPKLDIKAVEYFISVQPTA